MTGSILDVVGIRVGHSSRVGNGFRTGVTVIMPPPGTRAAVSVRGGGPATSQTDILAGATISPHPHAIALTGGSAYGLPAAQAGVMAWLAERGIGFPVGMTPEEVVPIVPTAAIFDLGRGGDFAARPTPEMGGEAAEDAAGQWGLTWRGGRVGAGTGAAVDQERGIGGVGGASSVVSLAAPFFVEDGAAGTPALSDEVPPLPPALPVASPTTIVGALAVVNAGGVPDVPYSPWDGPTRDFGLPQPAITPGTNTTLVVLATPVSLDHAALKRVASVAHDGFARALNPVHSLADGDVVFALSTSAQNLPPSGSGPMEALAHRAAIMAIEQAAAEVTAQAIRNAVTAN